MLDYRQIPGLAPFADGEPDDGFFNAVEEFRSGLEFTDEWRPYADQWYLSLEMILKTLFERQTEDSEIGIDLLATVLKMAETIRPECGDLTGAARWMAQTAPNLLPEASRDGSEPSELAPALSLLGAASAYFFREDARADFKLLFAQAWLEFYGNR